MGYTFRNHALLLREALNHSSYANEHRAHGLEQSNERLEFLGDSVLGFVTAEFLFARHPDLPEGDLTRDPGGTGVRAEPARGGPECWIWASYLKLGKGEEAGGGRHRGLHSGGCHRGCVCRRVSGRRHYRRVGADPPGSAGRGEGRGGGGAPPGLQDPAAGAHPAEGRSGADLLHGAGGRPRPRQDLRYRGAAQRRPPSARAAATARRNRSRWPPNPPWKSWTINKRNENHYPEQIAPGSGFLYGIFVRTAARCPIPLLPAPFAFQWARLRHTRGQSGSPRSGRRSRAGNSRWACCPPG